jgi:hypothetical protein
MPAMNLPIGTGASRIPPRAQTSDESGMVDRRRWTSFLTWAFILSEMAARDGLLPTAAHAGDDDLGRTSHTGSDTAPIVNNLPNINVSTATEGPEPITYQHAATLPSYAPTQLSSELADAKTALGSDTLPHGLGTGGGGGGAGYHSDAVPGDGAVDATGVHLSLGEGQLFALGHDGQLLDLGLHLDLTDTVHGLLSGVADTLDALLGDVGDSLVSTTGNLLALVGIRGDGAGAHGYSNDVGMPGHLSFGDTEASVQPHELATPNGGYTTYGIALNLGSADTPVSGEAAVHADALGASVLDNLVDHLPGSHLDTSSDASHLDQAVLRTASDILA